MPTRPTGRITFGTLAVASLRRIVNLAAQQRLPWGENNMTIRILLIDEHRPAREVLARRLDSMPGMDVVGSTCDGDQAIKEIEGLNPDVVLIDTKMKQADGMEICRRALAADQQATVAVLTSYLDPDERRLAYEAGVNGYLLKDVDTSNLTDWIKLAVGQGEDDPDDEPE